MLDVFSGHLAAGFFNLKNRELHLWNENKSQIRGCNHLKMMLKIIKLRKTKGCVMSKKEKHFLEKTVLII